MLKVKKIKKLKTVLLNQNNYFYHFTLTRISINSFDLYDPIVYVGIFRDFRLILIFHERRCVIVLVGNFDFQRHRTYSAQQEREVVKRERWEPGSKNENKELGLKLTHIRLTVISQCRWRTVLRNNGDLVDILGLPIKFLFRGDFTGVRVDCKIFFVFFFERVWNLWIYVTQIHSF